MYTGVVSCIVKLPDEVFVGNAKRVGENKRVIFFFFFIIFFFLYTIA